MMSERDDCSRTVREIARSEFLLRWALRTGCLLLALGLCYGGYRGYGVWRQQHLRKQLGEFVARGEFQSGVLVARRLLDLDQDDLAAYRAMAAMAETANRPEAVVWRQRIAQLEPASVDNKFALARTALRFGRIDLADAVLKSISQPASTRADFNAIAGALALARKDFALAEMHFAAAEKADSADPQLALNLAVIRLGLKDPELARVSRAKLAQLTAEPRVRREALRALASDALARNDRKQAAKWMRELQVAPDATFADTLLYFQAVEGTEAAAPALAQLQAKAATSPATAAELVTWLNRHGMAVVAAAWGARLPADIRDAQPVPLAISESFSYLRDWAALRSFVEGKDWGTAEALRLAVESHALHRLSPPERPSMETQTVWRAALKAAQPRPEQLTAIAQLAAGWGYAADAEEAWWMLAANSEHARTALGELQRLYKSKQDTRGLLRVAKRAVELNPNDLIAANNCANLGILVNGDSASRRLAAKLHQEHPNNHAFATTYAYALYAEGKLAEALKLIERLKEEELQHPAVAAYYVVMLVDNGQLERARAYLANAQRAALLPEEQLLLSAATRKLLASDTNDVGKRFAGPASTN